MGSTDDPDGLARPSTRAVLQHVRCMLVPAAQAEGGLADTILDLANGEEIVSVSVMEANGKRVGPGVHVTLVTRRFADG